MVSSLERITWPFLATKVACCRTRAGNTDPTWLKSCEIEASFDTGKHRVGGRFSPAKVVNSTLMVAILASQASQQQKRLALLESDLERKDRAGVQCGQEPGK